MNKKVNIYTFGYENDERFNNEPLKEDIFVDARVLKGLNVGINNLGIDKATRRKYLRNDEIKKFYEDNIYFPAREKLNNDITDFNVFIFCHQGMHKSVCLGEQLFIDLTKRKDCNVNIVHKNLIETSI